MSDDSIFLQGRTVFLKPWSNGNPWNDWVEEAGDRIDRHIYVPGDVAWIIFGEQVKSMFRGLLIQASAPREKFIKSGCRFR